MALPDFVNGGRVMFNRLVDGIPTFTRTSTSTRAPINQSDRPLPQTPGLDAIADAQRASSPLDDTVRRWLAPYHGRVRIEGSVTLTPPPDLRPHAPPAYDGDGVRVSIQRGPFTLWAHRFTQPQQSATPTNVDDVFVAAGQAIYFRTQSIDHGVGDEVQWDPEITYIERFGTALNVDPNGRSLTRFEGSEDFTTAGMPWQKISLPLKGVVRFEGKLRKAKATTDDVHVIVKRNGVAIVDDVIGADEVLATGRDYGFDLQASEPTDDMVDQLEIRVQIDTDIDVTAIDWEPRLYYTQAEKDGKPIPVEDAEGKKLLELPVPSFVDAYGTDMVTPYKAFGAVSDELRFAARLVTDGARPGSKVVVTVKQPGQLRVKKRLTIMSDAENHVTGAEFGADLDEDEPVWIDVTFEDASTAKSLDFGGTQVAMIGGIEDLPLPFTVWYPGPHDYFSPPYRGWGYAAYEANDLPLEAPLDETAFEYQEEDLDPDNLPPIPDTFDLVADVGASASPFIPYRLRRYRADGTLQSTVPVWRGSKDNIVGASSFASSSRRGADDPDAVKQPILDPGDGVNAPQLVGIGTPQFSLTAGFLGFVAAFGAGNSFGLVDYTDMNGDGFPDVITPGNIEYTGPRGAYIERPRRPGHRRARTSRSTSVRASEAPPVASQARRQRRGLKDAGRWLTGEHPKASRRRRYGRGLRLQPRRKRRHRGVVHEPGQSGPGLGGGARRHAGLVPGARGGALPTSTATVCRTRSTPTPAASTWR